MKEKTKAYFAGFIDGDGTLNISFQPDSDGYRNYRAEFKAYNTYLPVLKWMVHHFGGTWYFNREANEKHKAGYIWSPQGAKHTDRILSFIEPYLQVKKLECELIRSYLALDGKKNPNERWRLYLLCKQQKDRNSVTTDTLDFSDKPNLVNAYFAGLLDAEGTITIKKRDEEWGSHYVVEISGTNTHEPIMRAWQSYYGGSIYPRKRGSDRQWQFDWAIYGKEHQEKFLLKMLPYLIVKRHQANTVLQFLRMNGGHDNLKRRSLYEQLEKEDTA